MTHHNRSLFVEQHVREEENELGIEEATRSDGMHQRLRPSRFRVRLNKETLFLSQDYGDMSSTKDS
jgi:hypothetical protein